MPLVIILFSLFIFYKVNFFVVKSGNRRYLLPLNILIISLYIFFVTIFAESSYYNSLVQVFENQRFSGGLTVLNIDKSFFLFGLVVLFNPLLTLIGELVNPIGSNLLLMSSIYWIFFCLYILFVSFNTKKSIIIPVYMSTLILTLPQIFTETAARYNIMIPFLFFIYFFMVNKDDIRKIC